MSVQTIIHGNNVGIIHKWSGPITSQDIFSLNRKVISSEKFREYKFWLTDFSNLTDIQFSNDDVETVIGLNHQAQKINPDIVAVVIASEDLAFGLSRMWEMMAVSIHWDKMVFRKKEAACRFIDERIKEKYEIDKLQWTAIVY